MTTNLSAQATAAAYIAAKGPKARGELLAYTAAKAKASARKRWARLHAAMLAGDADRLRYYAATGEAKREAVQALRAATTPAKPAPKARKAPAKAKATPAKARNTPAKATPLEQEAERIAAAAKQAGLSPERAAALMAAFLAV